MPGFAASKPMTLKCALSMTLKRALSAMKEDSVEQDVASQKREASPVTTDADSDSDIDCHDDCDTSDYCDHSDEVDASSETSFGLEETRVEESEMQVPGFQGCFNAFQVNGLVTVSEDGLQATRLDGRVSSSNGLVFGDMPFCDDGQASAYFGVWLDNLYLQDPDESIVIGFTTIDPNTFSLKQCESFEFADCVPCSWSFGYDGQKFTSKTGQFQRISCSRWQPSSLREGSHVAVTVLDERAYFLVDGCCICEADSPVPAGCRLWPFVDLLGSARQVSIARGDIRYTPPSLDQTGPRVGELVSDVAEQSADAMVALAEGVVTFFQMIGVSVSCSGNQGGIDVC
jgi:hypothetical protein